MSSAKDKENDRLTLRVAENMKRLRNRKYDKLSQEELAKRSGVSRATIAQIEMGRPGSLTMSTITALSEALGVGAEDLIVENDLIPMVESSLDRFDSSPWGEAVKPTIAEKAWLRSLNARFWRGLKPSPQFVAELVLLRRRALRIDSR